MRLDAAQVDRVALHAMNGDPVAIAWMLEHFVEAEAASMGLEVRL